MSAMTDIEATIFEPSIVYMYACQGDVRELFENILQMSNQITSNIVNVANLLSVDLKNISNTGINNSNNIFSEGEHETNNSAQKEESIGNLTTEKSLNTNAKGKLVVNLRCRNLESLIDRNNINEEYHNENVEDNFNIEEAYGLSTKGAEEVSMFEEQNIILNSNSTNLQSESAEKNWRKDINRVIDDVMKKTFNKDDIIPEERQNYANLRAKSNMMENEMNESNIKIEPHDQNNEYLENDIHMSYFKPTSLNDMSHQFVDSNKIKPSNNLIKEEFNNRLIISPEPEIDPINNAEIEPIKSLLKLKDSEPHRKVVKSTVKSPEKFKESEPQRKLTKSTIKNQMELKESEPRKELTKSIKESPVKLRESEPQKKLVKSIKSPVKLEESESQRKLVKSTIKSPVKLKERAPHRKESTISRDLLKLLLNLKGAKTKGDWLACRKDIQKHGACWECGTRACQTNRETFHETFDDKKYVCKGPNIRGAFWHDKLQIPVRNRVKVRSVKSTKKFDGARTDLKKSVRAKTPQKNSSNGARVQLKNIPSFITDSDIIECFERFSGIKKFYMRSNICVLSLENFPEVAKMLIRRGKCKIQGQEVKIKTLHLSCKDRTCCGPDF